MRSELGPGYKNYTSKHFSNFNISYTNLVSAEGQLFGVQKQGHSYNPETGILTVSAWASSGDPDYTVTFTYIFDFTLICLE